MEQVMSALSNHVVAQGHEVNLKHITQSIALSYSLKYKIYL